MNRTYLHHILSALLLTASVFTGHARGIIFSGSPDNDLYRLLKSENFDVKLCPDASSAIVNAEKGDGVIISASDYPQKSVELSEQLLKDAASKGLRVYA